MSKEKHLIDESVKKDLIAEKMKKELSAIRAEEYQRRKEQEAIDAATRLEEDGMVEVINSKGESIPHGVWEIVSGTRKKILSASELKAYDDYRSAMMSLLGLYTELNAALYYSIGEIVPSLKKSFGPGFKEFLDRQLGAGAGELLANCLDDKAAEFGNALSKVGNSVMNLGREALNYPTVPHIGLPEDELVNRELLVDDLINMVDFNPNAIVGQQFYGILNGLPANETNKEKFNEFKATFGECMRFWLSQHGYSQEGRGQYKKGREPLTKDEFDLLRNDPDKGIKQFLMSYFDADLKSEHQTSPRI